MLEYSSTRVEKNLHWWWGNSVVVLSETAAHTRFRSVFTEGFYFLVSR